MMVLVPLADVYVTANFKETQLRDMKIGQIAMLHVDAFPNRTIKARIDSFAPASGAKFSLLPPERSEEHTSELQSLMRISYAVFCLKKNRNTHRTTTTEA